MSPQSPATAIVLAAGIGTRLRPLSYARAKGAVPVAGEPLLNRVLRWLAFQGIATAIVNLHHRPETITAALGDGSDLGLAVRYSFEPRILGSAGGPRRALALVDDDRAWIINGDTLTDLDLAPMARAHADTGARVTMALVPHPAPRQYGGVAVDGDGCILGFTRPGEEASALHFIGVQLAERGVFDAVRDGARADTVGGIYPALIAAAPGSLRGHVSRAAFRDIGTPAGYLATSLALAPPSAPALVGARVQIAPSARLDRCVVWDDVVIEEDVALVECVVADNVRVPRGLQLERMAIVRAEDAPAEARGPRTGGLLIEPLDTRPER